MNKKVCLVVIDGFGISKLKNSPWDATTHAINIQQMKKEYSWTSLKASGKYVGLPDKFNGNSEVGHMTIGAGRRVPQSLMRIKNSTETWNIPRIPQTGRVHLIGMVSDGGVHSHTDCIRFLKSRLNCTLVLHAIADGIDVEPGSFEKYISEFRTTVGSVCGRYYAMDRNQNLERTEVAFQVLTGQFKDAIANSDTFPENNINEYIMCQVEYNQKLRSTYASFNSADEYIPPFLLKSSLRIMEGEPVIFFNYRADRMRQIAAMFIKYADVYTMTDYGLEGVSGVILESKKIFNTLPQWLSKHKKTQMHIAESEKYAHVTYFFNGGDETQQPGEERILVPSAAVSSFGSQPETSMREATKECLKALERGFDFILVNLAGPDLLGHTGMIEGVKASVIIMDSLVKNIQEKCLALGYTLIITSDHGNSEEMCHKNAISKSHTRNSVPFIIASKEYKATLRNRKQAELADVAPTIIDILGLNAPEEMTGKSLIKNK